MAMWRRRTSFLSSNPWAPRCIYLAQMSRKLPRAVWRKLKICFRIQGRKYFTDWKILKKKPNYWTQSTSTNKPATWHKNKTLCDRNQFLPRLADCSALTRWLSVRRASHCRKISSWSISFFRMSRCRLQFAYFPSFALHSFLQNSVVAGWNMDRKSDSEWRNVSFFRTVQTLL